ncbi:MAG: hypothetical protein A3E98_03200, partial [Candidatus Doudnabacteria bacterium RIFCSPHIGHO2_12_FULL_48_11]
MNGLIPISEAARLSGYSAERIRQFCVAGTLPASKIGNSWQVEVEALFEMIASPDPGLLPIAQAAKLSGYSSERVRQLCAVGKIPGQKIGTQWMVRQKDVDKFFAQKKSITDLPARQSFGVGGIRDFIRARSFPSPRRGSGQEIGDLKLLGQDSYFQWLGFAARMGKNFIRDLETAKVEPRKLVRLIGKYPRQALLVSLSVFVVVPAALSLTNLDTRLLAARDSLNATLFGDDDVQVVASSGFPGLPAGALAKAGRVLGATKDSKSLQMGSKNNDNDNYNDNKISTQELTDLIANSESLKTLLKGSKGDNGSKGE